MQNVQFLCLKFKTLIKLLFSNITWISGHSEVVDITLVCQVINVKCLKTQADDTVWVYEFGVADKKCDSLINCRRMHYIFF